MTMQRRVQRPRAPISRRSSSGRAPSARSLLMRAAWPAAVGPELARRTEVVAIDGGVLRVRVPDATWQRGLARMRGDILRRPARDRGRRGAALAGLRPRARCRVPGTRGAVRDPGAADSGGAPALARPAPAQVLAAAQSIPDPQLRERFLAAAARYLARFSPGARQ